MNLMNRKDDRKISIANFIEDRRFDFVNEADSNKNIFQKGKKLQTHFQIDILNRQ